MPFYTFTQSPLHDRVKDNGNLAHHTIIEAESSTQANMIGQALGMVFTTREYSVEREYSEPHRNYTEDEVARWHRVDAYDGYDQPAVFGDDVLRWANPDPEELELRDRPDLPHTTAVIYYDVRRGLPVIHMERRYSE